jgi:receptor expression-enhancing protein 5/6
MASLQDRMQKYMTDLDREVPHNPPSRPNVQLSKYPSIVKIEKHIGISKLFLALGVGFIYFFFIFLNYGGQILCNLVGFIFPAYESIRALETPGTADDTQWLTYWVVFSFFNILEYWSRTILYWLRLSRPTCRADSSVLLSVQNDYCAVAGVAAI